jgi:putative DNA primase/helicase
MRETAMKKRQTEHKDKDTRRLLPPITIEAEVCSPDSVGLAIAAELDAFFRRYVVLPLQEYFAILVLWVLFAHAHDAFVISPILSISSPTKRSAKTRLLEALSAVVPRPLLVSHATAAALFRAIDAYCPTLLVDEADTFIRRSEDLRSVLNSGHTRSSARIVRAAGTYSTWAPKVIALIGSLPDTVQDRAISIRIQRKGPGEKVERLRQDELVDMDLRARAAGWAAEHLDALSSANPAVPESLGDRQADCWRPLLALADILGEDWPRRARDAAVTLSRLADEDDEELPVQLLVELARLIGQSERMASAAIVKALVAMPERTWSTCVRGRPLTELHLSLLLRPFGVRPRQWGEGPKAHRRNVRGYYLTDLQPVFLRYVPRTPDVPGTPGTPAALGR